MRNDFYIGIFEDRYLAHSAKGTTWSKKNHKYVKKVGDRYYYTDKKDDQILDLDEIVETPDFEDLPEKIDRFRPEWIKKFNNTAIWSPNKDQETLVSKGKDEMNKLIRKSKRRAAIRRARRNAVVKK